MTVIEGLFEKPKDLEERVIHDMVAVLEASIQETVEDAVDYLIVLTFVGDDINAIRVEGCGATDRFRAIGALEAAKVAIAAGA